MTTVPLSIVHELLSGQHHAAAIEARKALRHSQLRFGTLSNRHVLDVGTGWGASLAVFMEDCAQAEGIEKVAMARQWTHIMWQSTSAEIERALALDPLAGSYSDAERRLAVRRFDEFKQERKLGGVDFSLGLPVHAADVLDNCPGFHWSPYDCVIGNVCLDDLVEQRPIHSMTGTLPGLSFHHVMETLARLVRPGGRGIFTLMSNEFACANVVQDRERWDRSLFRHPFMLYCMDELFQAMGSNAPAEWSTHRDNYEGLTEGRAEMSSPSWQFIEVSHSYAPSQAPLPSIVRAPLLYLPATQSLAACAKWAGVVDEIIKKALAEGTRLRPYEDPGLDVYTLVFERK